MKHRLLIRNIRFFVIGAGIGEFTHLVAPHLSGWRTVGAIASLAVSFVFCANAWSWEAHK